MNKKVLLAESSQVTRNIAEKILRQHGFEVISVSNGEKAVEVIEFSRPDIILVGSDLKVRGNKPLYDKFQDEPRTSSVPMLILCDEDASCPFPDEVLIKKPFEPKDLIDKVMIFAGQTDKVEKAEKENPFGGEELKDDLLDNALGLDRIEVTDAEEMNREKTVVGKKEKTSQTAEKLIGMEKDTTGHSETSGTKIVQSLIISDEGTDIVSKNPMKKTEIADEDKLELDEDQFGITSSGGAKLDDDTPDDYNWFVNEMQNEGQESSKIPQQQKEAKPVAMPDDDELSFLDPSVDPSASVGIKINKSKKNEKGVDKFIEEFKKEVENIDADTPKELNLTDSQEIKKEKEHLRWEEKIENLTEEQLSIFTRQFAADLSAKLAKLMIDKIDTQKLLGMMKSEIFTQSQKKSER